MKIEDITAKDFKSALKDPQSFEAKRRMEALKDTIVNELNYVIGTVSYIKMANKTIGVKFIVSLAQPGEYISGHASYLHHIVEEAFKGWGESDIDRYNISGGRAFAYEVWYEGRE